MKRGLTFDDVLIAPKFSDITSRKDVSLKTYLGDGLHLDLPIISSNMDTVTESDMAIAMAKNGGVGCLHRFCSRNEMVEMYKKTKPYRMILSFGLGDSEKARVVSMVSNGATHFCLDVAHGAQKAVAEHTRWFKHMFPHCWLMVGNFASQMSLLDYFKHVETRPNSFLRDTQRYPDAVKIGVGPGSACTTRIKTGIGMPQLTAIQDAFEITPIYNGKIKLIADGGMRTPGDIAKAIAAGADAVMLGGMLAGTEETPGEVVEGVGSLDSMRSYVPPHKIYRGSASKESYEAQGKDWSCAEGACFTVPYKGPVKNILEDIEGGLRSALTYVGARNLNQFRKKAEFVRVTANGVKENGAHGAS